MYLLHTHFVNSFSFLLLFLVKIDDVETIKTKASMMEHTCNLSAGKTETGGSAVQGQPQLFNINFLSLKKGKKEKKNKGNPCENCHLEHLVT